MVRRALAMGAVVAGMSGMLLAQTPQPFPRPASPQPAAPPTAPRPAVTPQTPQTPPAPVDPAAPTEAMLGVSIYPAAQFLASYDAGRGQRYYLFGSTAPYADLVAYYRTQLRNRGDEVFTEPPTHMFEVGRFRSESMAFPPGVTIKDWTWGSQGYPNPKPGGQPARFPTVIMIVPAPPAAPATR